ncbi:ubiquinone/menaquinone biosynthesis methyltransferase UbiE [Clavulina sp. PMI_390]|nr:ubiquinone/menaquinone biosynthesis methyltransferase UbiE [Clavulina sp. PMI_390]
MRTASIISRTQRLASRVPSRAVIRSNHSTPSGKEGPQTTHFGFRTVPTGSKESLVREVFSSVAGNYDLMNDAMSMGVHRLWKNEFVSMLNPGSSGPIKCLDVAGGSGDISMRILDHAREKFADRETHVTVSDINPDMLEEGKRRFKQSMYWNTPQVGFEVANAQALPFADNSFDLYTISFGIRNCTSIPDVLSEAYRVLKPGGTFACLEFSKVGNPVLAQLYESYSFSVIPMMGSILASDRDSYQYLVESIARFPKQEEFAQMIQDAGFRTGVQRDGGAWTDLWQGIAAIHTGVKL